MQSVRLGSHHFLVQSIGMQLNHDMFSFETANNQFKRNLNIW